ncbi:YhbY family RNA-binding protein [Kistimonas asteriae]|uniref:YhbY family RNA-binding protein n=1 Tax=Kistimonas asteriae TaxID=517724 RepID=UPI001BA8F0F5|nr:YhbY family RNA-binding protein [Kistimonas asteriae]
MLSSERKRSFRAIGHNLKPVVTIADNGITEGVVEETRRALDDHELIKVKFAIGDRDARRAVIAELCGISKAELVQTIGKVALIYKAAKEPSPRLSNILRQHG